MADNEIHVCHGTLIVTFRCTLKCKLCCVYAPYYKGAKDYPLQELERSVTSFFQLIDFCEVFNIQGGEPLLHPDLSRVIEHVMKYKGQIKTVLLTTNGTLMPKPELIEVLRRFRDSIQVNISNYGPDLSRKVPQLTVLLNENGIRNNTFKYYGTEMHYGGWLDFTDHTFKNLSEEELIRQCEECGCRSSSQFAIRGGELFCCGRNMRRSDLGIIPKDEKSRVDMFDSRTVSEKRENVRAILSAKYTPACPYCTGKRLGREHESPAVQLTPEELESGAEKMDLQDIT